MQLFDKQDERNQEIQEFSKWNKEIFTRTATLFLIVIKTNLFIITKDSLVKGSILWALAYLLYLLANQGRQVWAAFLLTIIWIYCFAWTMARNFANPFIFGFNFESLFFILLLIIFGQAIIQTWQEKAVEQIIRLKGVFYDY